jgi:hypothetical protein
MTAIRVAHNQSSKWVSKLSKRRSPRANNGIVWISTRKSSSFFGRLIDPGAIETRTALAIEQSQREQVIHWLLSNHDGHAKQFLRTRNGKVYGIDNGQLFKHLGEDRLSIDYHPNARYRQQEPFYNTLFRVVKEGKVEV